MVVFPNAKINLGLFIVGKRPDGFHDLESIFLPIGLKDVLEVMINPNPNAETIDFRLSGCKLDGAFTDNLVIKAFNLLRQDYKFPAIKVALHKHIPPGSGLGGGSSDGTFMVLLLNNLFKLHLTKIQIHHYLTRLGSDCPFFAENRISYVKGRGDKIDPVENHPGRIFLVVIVPPIHIHTAEIFKLVIPAKREQALPILFQNPVDQWKYSVTNDFEKVLFPNNPSLKEIKDKLNRLGAVYCSMSGSGSALFGLFREAFDPNPYFKGCTVWKEWIFENE